MGRITPNMTVLRTERTGFLYDKKWGFMKDKSVPTRGRTLDYAAFLYDVLEPVLMLGKLTEYDEKILSLLDLIVAALLGTSKTTETIVKILLDKTIDATTLLSDFTQRYSLKLPDLSPAHRVLDLGCGTGVLTSRIADQLDAAAGGICIGIDAAAKMIRLARRKRGIRG